MEVQPLGLLAIYRQSARRTSDVPIGAVADIQNGEATMKCDNAPGPYGPCSAQRYPHAVVLRDYLEPGDKTERCLIAKLLILRWRYGGIENASLALAQNAISRRLQAHVARSEWQGSLSPVGCFRTALRRSMGGT